MEMAATALVAAALEEGDRGGDEEGGEGTEGSGSDSSSTDEEGIHSCLNQTYDHAW